MKTPWLLVGCAAATLAWVTPAEARSFRVSQIPNGNNLGCGGCHTTNFGGARNPFGQSIEQTLQGNLGNAPARWGAVYDLDSDGDGFTNGEEMKDPFGAWTTGQADPGLNSHPGNAAQIPTSQGQRPTAQDVTHTTDEDEVYTGQLQATDADNNIVRYRIVAQPTRGTLQLTDAALGTYTYTPQADYSGTDTFTFQVFDGTNILGTPNGNAFTAQPARVTINISPVNDPPTVVTDGDQTGFEGQALAFEVSADDPEDGALALAVEGLPRGASFDDQTGEFEWTPDFDQAGDYLLTFRATDSGGATETETVQITVVNVTQPPTITALNAPTTANEGETSAFSVQAQDPDGDPLTYTWTFGTGDTAQGQSVTYVWPRYGSFNVSVAVSDGFNVVTQAATVQVNNLPPTANAGDDQTVNEGQTFTATGAYTDPGPGATFTYVWNFGNGTTRTNRVETYAYADDGTFNASFTVSDGQLSDDDAAVFTVLNVAPTADAGNNRTIDEGASYTFTGTYTDPGTLDTHTQVWDYGDGQSGGGTHTYPDQGTYTVTYTVTDDDGGAGTDTVTATVLNVAPSVRSQPLLTAPLDQLYSYQIVGYDPGQDTITYTFLEGPTGMQVNPTTGLVTYTPLPEHDLQRYTVRVRLDDEDGGTYTHQYTLLVGVQDRDNDGAVDDCEVQYGLDPDDPNDGPLDTDGDGLTNAQECVDGKNPRVSNAPTAPSINDPFSGSVVTRLPPIALVVNNANDPDGDPISYIFELYADAQLATLLRTWREVPQGVNRTSVNIDVPLNENGRYYWRVRATDGPGYSAWTNIAYFTYSVINEAPGVPTTLEPTGQVRQNPSFVFQTSVDPEGDPISYEIKVFAPGDTFHSGAVGLIAIGNQDRITWTSPRPFDENTEYTWQVRATNNQIVASDWSPLSTFFYNSVNAPPTQPELLAPLEGAVLAENADLLFSATGSTDEDGDPITYVARISTDAGFLPESVVAQQDGLPVGPGNIVSWDLAPNRAVLDENTTYWWDIRAKDAEAYSPASAASFFVSFVDDPPGTPALQAPASEESLRTQTPTFAWVNTSDPEDEPLTYAIAVYRDANLTDIAWQKTEIPAIGGDGGLSTVIPEVALSDNTSYFWRVRAVELDGGLGPWSEALRFTVALGGQPPTKPLLAGPANGAIFKPTDPVDLLWRPSSDPEDDPITYRIEVLNQGGQLVTFKEGLTATAEINTYRLEITLADGNYNWRIKAYSASQESPWSNSALFTILTPIVDPNANNTNNTNNENNADNNGQDPDDEEPTDTGGAAKAEGCAQATGGPSGGSAALLALGLAWLWSRRRRR